METTTPYQPGATLRTLSLLLSLARILLTAFTVVAIALLGLGVFGVGEASVNGVLDHPFTIELDDGRRIGVIGDNSLSYEGFDRGRDHDNRIITEAPEARATLAIADDDTASRVVILLTMFAWLVAAWVGLIALRATVSAAMEGEPFSSENPRRLRMLAGAIFAIAAIHQLSELLLSRTVDTNIPFRVDTSTSIVWLIISGLIVLALAELFAEAARLRAFEEATI